MIKKYSHKILLFMQNIFIAKVLCVNKVCFSEIKTNFLRAQFMEINSTQIIWFNSVRKSKFRTKFKRYFTSNTNLLITHKLRFKFEYFIKVET